MAYDIVTKASSAASSAASTAATSAASSASSVINSAKSTASSMASGVSSKLSSMFGGTASADGTSSTNSTTGNSNNVPNFVDNVWIANANDKLAVKDVYTEPSKDVVNDTPLKPTTMSNGSSWFSSLKNGVKSLASGLRTVRGVVKSIKDVKSALMSGDVTLAARALGDNKTLQSAMDKLDIKITPALIDKVQENVKIGITVNGVYKDAKATNFNDINSVGKLLAIYSKDNNAFKISDLSADAATACAVVNACVKNGVPNSVPTALAVLGQDGPIKQFVAGTLGTVVKKSDIEALHDLHNAIGKSGLVKLNPNVVSDISKVFSNPVFAALPDKATYFEKTVATFDKVDPKWCTNTVGADATVDITKITTGSDDLKSLYTQCYVSSAGAKSDAGIVATGSVEANKLLGFGTLYNPTSVVSELNGQFPATIINSDVVNRHGITNPVLANWTPTATA